jgi:pimeloyl-ACP methyl ester carboxylesterase
MSTCNRAEETLPKDVAYVGSEEIVSGKLQVQAIAAGRPRSDNYGQTFVVKGGEASLITQPSTILHQLLLTTENTEDAPDSLSPSFVISVPCPSQIPGLGKVTLRGALAELLQVAGGATPIVTAKTRAKCDGRVRTCAHMIPVFILQIWLLGLLSLGVVAGAVYLAYEWQHRSWGWDPLLQRWVFAPDFGWNQETMLFVAAVVLTVIALAGGPLVKAILRLTKPSKGGADDVRKTPTPKSHQRLRRPDGSELQVEFYGPENGIPIILTHGWGLDSREWNYLKKDLSDGFRLIAWDEPGLGKSNPPTNRDYDLTNLARHLEAVLALAGEKPAILLGHSIGGMITLTFCDLFPALLGSRVIGLVLTHTTPTNPVRTTSGGAFFTAIEKPVLVPLMYLTIALSPLVWLMNWLSYLNGSAHLSTKQSSFAGRESWEQIDFFTSFQPQASPAVMARGMLGMIRYNATQALARITVPTLVIAGDRDGVTKPEASERIRSGIPQARLITLSPAKHLGLIEHHIRYADVVREFAYAAHA